MISPRLIATLGFGGGARQIATAGLSAVVTAFASLGWGGPAGKKRRKKREEEEAEKNGVIAEAIPEQAVSRLRAGMLGASLAGDIAARAKRARSDEDALILLIST